MRVAQEKVAEFHRKYGYPVAEKPTLIGDAQIEFRRMLIAEELREYLEAAFSGDLVKVADGLGDLIYVILGTANYHGIDLQPVLDEIHRSNMTKELSKDDIDKPVKGPKFSPPRIAELLLVQTTGVGDAL